MKAMTQYNNLLNRDAAALNISTELDFKKDGMFSYLVSLHILSHLRRGYFRNHFYLNNSKGKK